MLVEGQDLTVRDNHVFLKTLSGLERVDVILRRVDDDFCDPLELRNDSILGVPGLVEAVRAGNVVMANALGSGRCEVLVGMRSTTRTRCGRRSGGSWLSATERSVASIDRCDRSVTAVTARSPSAPGMA